MSRRILFSLSILFMATIGGAGCGGSTSTAETYTVAYTIEMVGSSCSSLQYDPGTGALVTVTNPANTWHVNLTGLPAGDTVEIKATCSALPGASFSAVTVTQLGTGSTQGIVVDSVTTATVVTNTVVACDKKTLAPLPL